MAAARRPVRYSWAGAFPGYRELPACPLYDVFLRFAHDANGQAVGAVRTALEPLAGPSSAKRWPFAAPRLVWSSDRWAIDTRIQADKVEVRLGHRIKPKALSRLVEALASVPGSRDLLIEANVPEHQEKTDEGGAPSCCH